MRYKKMLLAGAMVLGFIAAELPSNVKDYTETSTAYSLESYGSELAARPAPAAERLATVNG